MSYNIVAIVVDHEGDLLSYMPNFYSYVEDIDDSTELFFFQSSCSDTTLNSYLYWNILHFLKWREENLPNCDIVLSILDIQNALEELDYILDIADIQMRLDNLIDLKLIKTIRNYLWDNILTFFAQQNASYNSYDIYRITERAKDILGEIDSPEQLARIIRAMPNLV
jgi:hypothetical protein